MMKAILTIGMLALASGSTDTFHFTQCECPKFQFNSALKKNFPNPLVISGNSGLFNCPGNGSFPEESGLIVDVTDVNSRLSTSGVDTDLFDKIVQGTKKGWNAVFRISFIPEDAEFNLIEIFNNGRNVYKIPLLIQPSRQRIRIAENSGNILFLSISPGEEVTLDVVVGDVIAATDDGGASIGDFSFVCASVNNDDVNCVADIKPIIVDSNTATNIELFKSTAASSALKISILSAEFNNDGIADGTIANTFEEFLSKLASKSADIIAKLPKVISLPIPKEVTSFSTNEDEDLSGNLFNLLTGGTLTAADLTFGIEANPTNGLISTDDLAKFVYSPNKDFNGDDSFTLSYGISSPFECFNTVEASISIAAEPDPPVAKDLSIQVFANIATLVSEEIATDVDEEDGKMNGKLTFDNIVPGVISASCDSTEPITEATVTDGSVSFCYTPDDSMVDGGLAILRFTVTDEDGTTDSGTITFTGNDPVVLAAENPVQVLNEDGSVTFSLGKDRYGQRLPGAEDTAVKIRVTRLPGFSDGVLKDSKDGLVDLDSNSEFSDLDRLRFIPSRELFNAVAGSPFDASGELLLSCERRVAIDGVEGYCAISFEYKIFLGGVESEAQESFFLINAIDNGNPVITVGGKDADTVLVSQTLNSNDLAVASLSGVQISSDDGGNAFQLSMDVETTNGVQFKVNDPQNAKGIVVSDGANGGDSIEDCKAVFCTSVKIRGTPAQLKEMAANLEITMPLSALDPSMTLAVSDIQNLGSQEISIDFSFENNESESSNVGTIGGAVGVALLLAVGVGIGFVAFRKHKHKLRSSEIMMIDNNKDLDLEIRNLPNTAEEDEQKERWPSKEQLPDTWERHFERHRCTYYFYNRRRNAVAWYDSELKDASYGCTQTEFPRSIEYPWEAHIDRETDEVFFLNTVNGEITWLPPEVERHCAKYREYWGNV